MATTEVVNKIQDPSAVLDYIWDWGSWLDAGENITAHTVTLQPNEVEEMQVDSDSATSSRVTAWTSGGYVGRTYILTCHIVTNQNREDDRSFHITVKER